MPRKLPVSPKNRPLPFQDPSFGYGDFEGFFTEFLRLSPSIKISRNGAELEGRITNAWRYETSGDAQNGIDIRAEVQVTQTDGTTSEETWAFQCKHRAKWTEKQTRAAIQFASENFAADFHFLLLTCDLGTKAVNEGRSHPGWQMWSGRDITSRVRSLKNRDDAARLVNSYFGPDWAHEILGLPGSGPLQAVGAFFARQMESGCFHHHRAEIVGRQAELDSLHSFLGSPDQRLLILPGAGGGGKSRLLRAFAQSLTSAQRRKWSIRFYDDIGTPITERDLNALEGPPVIVIDDAHRQNIEPLLRLILRLKESKVILSTRPQGIALVRGAAAGAGIDARRISELPSLKRLTVKDTKRIAESLLGDEFRSLATNVVAQARGSLLIAIVACEMIRQKRITKSHLASHQDFEQAVFVRLIDERIAHLGLITDRDRIDRMLELVAFIGPMPREGQWFDLLCGWAAPTAETSKIRTWLDDLKRCGLLVEKGDGYRITPDLLSDYLLFRATFDTDHRDKGFVADVLARVAGGAKDEVLARCLPNLAEAEWRARCESDGRQQSVVEPLLERWLNQFRAASFKRRREMLGHWSRFGVYLPEQTLRIARLASELSTVGAPNEEGIFGAYRDDHSNVLDAIPPLLKEVARYHPEQMHACFDLLWVIGRDEPERWMHNNQYHPLSTIIEVAQLEYRKPVAVNEVALAWIEKTFRKPETLVRLKREVWWFKALLDPFLKHYVEEEEFDGEIISLQHIPVDARRVASLRSRVLDLVSTLAEDGEDGVVINSIKVLGQGIRMVNMPGVGDNDDLQQSWLPQRQAALGKLEQITLRKPSGFVAWSIWQELWWHICYEPAKLLRAECWRVFNLLEDTFELRLARAVCSSGDSEITPLHKADAPLKRDEGALKKSRELWWQLRERVAQESAERYLEAVLLHQFLADFVKQGAQLGFQPALGSVLFPLARNMHPAANSLAHEMLKSPREETKHGFESLVDGLSPQGQPLRLDLLELATTSNSSTLQEGAARLLIWWQEQTRLPESGEKMLFQLVRSGQTALVRLALHHASLLPVQHDSFVQRLLNSVLENPTLDDVAEPLLAALDRTERMNSAPLPSDLVESLLGRLVSVPQIKLPMEQHYLAHLAESYPKEIFTFYRQRVAHSQERPNSGLLDDGNYEAIPGHGEHVSLRHFAEMAEFETEFVKIRDELIAEMKIRTGDGQQRNVFERGGYHWHLRQFARWLMDDSGAKYASLASAWVPLVTTVEDLWLFLDVAVGDSAGFVLRHPQILVQLLHQIESRLPEHLEKARNDLISSVSRWVGSSSGLRWRKVGRRTPPEDEETCHVIPHVEKQIQAHLHHPILKAFYEELLGKCQSMLAHYRRVDELQWEDDEV